MTQQFEALTDRDIRDLCEHLSEQLAAWLFDHDIAGADRAPEWALAHRIGLLVRREHDMARRRARQQTRWRRPIAPLRPLPPDDAA